MRLVGVELVRTELSFLNHIGTAAGVHRERPVLYVRVVADDVEGWGECAALGDATSVDPPVDEVEKVAIDRAVPRLWSASAAAEGHLPSGAGDPPALRDLAGGTVVGRRVRRWPCPTPSCEAEGRSLAASLGTGPGFETMPVGAVVGIPNPKDADALLIDVGQALAGGSSRLRMKIEPGWDIEPVRAVRAQHPNLVLQVDANGSYRDTEEDVAALSSLADFDVLCVEQPLPPADLVALALLARKLPLPVCLDESLTSPRRVIDALRNGACADGLPGAGAASVACGRPGAPTAACAEAGVPAVAGGFPSKPASDGRRTSRWRLD